MPYSKPNITAPHLPSGLPHNKKEYTPEQVQTTITWLAFLPLMELRKRQILNDMQKKIALEKHRAGDISPANLLGLDNLEATDEFLMEAIDYRIFEWKLENPKGELALIPSQWSQKFYDKVMRYRRSITRPKRISAINLE